MAEVRGAGRVEVMAHATTGGSQTWVFLVDYLLRSHPPKAVCLLFFLTGAGEKQSDASSRTSCRLHAQPSPLLSSSSSSNPLWSRRESETKKESSLSGLGEGRIRSGLAPASCRHSNTLRTSLLCSAPHNEMFEVVVFGFMMIISRKRLLFQIRATE